MGYNILWVLVIWLLEVVLMEHNIMELFHRVRDVLEIWVVIKELVS